MPAARGASLGTGDSLWQRCPGCRQVLYRKDLERRLNVCPSCGHHFRLSVEQRLALVCDRGSFRETDRGLVGRDPLSFVGQVSYQEQLAEARERCGRSEAVVTGIARMGGREVGVAVFDFSFLGGSMGEAVGEKLARLMESAARERRPVVVFAASGGARMQEGIFSLVQMAKVVAARRRLADARVPFISVLTDPTTGGVAASLAMLGDINVGEPGALIGFAGPRVIEQTIRERLPRGFQRAESVLAHGMLDAVVERRALRPFLVRVLALLAGGS